MKILAITIMLFALPGLARGLNERRPVGSAVVVKKGRGGDLREACRKYELLPWHRALKGTWKTDIVTASDEFRQALIRVALIFSSSCLFGLGILFFSRQRALEYFACYLVEQSLSVDNIFVFIFFFDVFRVPLSLQPRVLEWGIIGSVVMRSSFIFMGEGLIKRFRYLVPAFAIMLLVAARLLLLEDEMQIKTAITNIAKSLNIPAVDLFDGEKFIVNVKGMTKATPLLLCLVCIELSDFFFAVDSIPAVLSISKDRWIAFASNLFAIMGLRSLYEVVARAVTNLSYLRPAVALILGFVGAKMLLESFQVTIATGTSLSVIAFFLSGGVGLSLLAGDSIIPQDKGPN